MANEQDRTIFEETRKAIAAVASSSQSQSYTPKLAHGIYGKVCRRQDYNKTLSRAAARS